MSATPGWVIWGTAAFATLGLGVVFALARRTGCGKRGGQRRSVERMSFTCATCRRELGFRLDELVALVPAERALVVRAKPDLVGRRLAEYVCPYCDASHCFEVEGGQATWVGSNLYSPQAVSVFCRECRKPLATPPWPAGQYDGRLEEAPALEPDYGLVCSRCGAVCCVECCGNLARVRTRAARWICPRCFRYPVETLFYP